MRRFVFICAAVLLAAPSVIIAQQEQEEEKKPGSGVLVPVPGEERPDDSVDAQIRALRERLRALERSLTDPPGGGWWIRRQPWPDGGFWVPGLPRVEEHLRDLEERFRTFGGGGGAVQRHFSMQVTPEGVRVEVRRQGEDGQEETRVFESESLEAFRRDHGDVLRDLGQGLGSGLWTPGRDRDPFPALDPFGGSGVERLFGSARALGGDRLGVQVSVPDEAQARDLALEEGEGLLVRGVEPGSLAARLGLREGDVLLRIGDRSIDGVQAVREALRKVRPGGTVTAEVARPGEGRVTLEAKKAPAVRGSV